ncbi:type VII secretion-associated serine protease mycosin [Streptomyces sp. NRRL F-5135]|uniref:type VII secretion-associated serine protease mycosin n=1 Tax=Streptomyces sp. NRRL F-5135 TaxID=1463858 RepID=UPI0006897221|nr:type VII secretion-associated serine protease mycosin [Streptomyces sp. NRRL F-5135]
MRTNTPWMGRGPATVLAVLGALLVGSAPAPAYADSIRSQQWHLDAMKADEIWKISRGEGVTVAVIDSGVDATNPDLQGRVLKGKDLASDSAGDERNDYDGHGTGMAGLIAGTGKSGGGDGAYGLAPGAKILPVRIRDADWDANRVSKVQEFNKSVSIAIRYAADNGAKVINISMGSRKGSQALASAVNYAIEKGALIFASTGNTADEGNGLEFPAGTPGVVGVGALDKEGKKTKESQYGPQVDVSAPGEEMVHACGGKTGLCTGHGTSAATAIASASAALIWSKHPDWTNNQVLRVMLNTVSGPTDGVKRNDYVGYGAVRPLRALTTPGDPGPADEYPLSDLAEAEAEASASSSAAAGDNDAQASPSTAAVEADKSGGAGLWIGLGVGAAVVLGAAVAVPVIRSRRG